MMANISDFFLKTAKCCSRFMFRISLLCVIVTGIPNSVSAFDTFWHFSAAAEVGRRYGFSEDAVRVLKFSSFCMDYFGPFITEVIGAIDKNVSYLEFQNLPTTGQTHAASNFMHFDNLAGRLDRNWKFDYLWSRLLENTQSTIISYYNDSRLNDDDRKKLILLTLGASIHMVEDFYSHTDWIHFNFIKMGFPKKKTDDGFDRAPTWYEVRKKLGAPSSHRRSENWKFHLCTGIFPPVDSVPKSTFDVPLSHTTMNHDNSQLYYSGASQIKFHGFGIHPATDSASAVIHQFFAYHTACSAAIEWIQILEENPAVNKAIEFAKGWDVSKLSHGIRDDLDDGLSSALMISCIMQKWDGNYPPRERDKDCGTLKILQHIHVPSMGNVFWGSFPKDSILQHLSLGIGDSTGYYAFDSLWIRKQQLSAIGKRKGK
jgi:hypothetical protein